MVSVARVALISKRRKSRLRGTEIMVGWLVMRRLGRKPRPRLIRVVACLQGWVGSRFRFDGRKRGEGTRSMSGEWHPSDERRKP